MLKKGQLTIFIIVGIVVLGSLAFFAVNKGIFSQLSPEADSVFNFVMSCIKQTGESGIFALGLQGGYYIPPTSSIEYGIPYYYKDGEGLMPQKSKIENEINTYINNNLDLCIKNFSDFSDLTIDAGEINTQALMADDSVILNVGYPLIIRKGESSSIIKEFKTEVPVRLGIIYKSAEEIIQEKMSHEGICISCMLDLAVENDLKISTSDYGNNTIIISISDENSKINNENFELVFAIEEK